MGELRENREAVEWNAVDEEEVCKKLRLRGSVGGGVNVGRICHRRKQRRPRVVPRANKVRGGVGFDQLAKRGDD